MKKILSILFFGSLISSLASAAQVGTVIVEEASVYEYPQSSSNVISKLSQDESVVVSNIPTEGFYKVRLPNGELGWVSGNDVFVGPSKPTASMKPRKRAKPEALPDAKALDDLREGDNDSASKPKKKRMKRGENYGEEEFAGDSSRILLMVGVQYPSYNGLKDVFITDGLTPGYGGVLEFQFMLSKHFHWGARAEINFAKVDSKDIGGGKTQTIKQSSIPLQLGLIYSPVTTRSFRLGFGVYGGAAVSSNVTISQATSTLSEQVEYASFDPTALGVVQMSFGLSDHIAVIAEGGYRYEKTGNFDPTARFGGTPKLQIDYSGPVGHLGFEFRF